jgi:hypothetical protein
LIDEGSSRGNIWATFFRTSALSLVGRTNPSSVTGTRKSGKIEKNAQKAIMLARLVDLSSLNLRNTAIGRPSDVCSC